MTATGRTASKNSGPVRITSAELRRERIEATCRIAEIRPLVETLEKRILGQDDAIDSLICSFARLLSGLHDPARPLLTGLLMGPTGVGKTETARALAQAIFGSEEALTRINCEEFAHGHEVAKLLGSPPGYVGHQIEPLLSQKRLAAAHHRLRLANGRENDLLQRLSEAHDGSLISVVLFDEIEKAHPVVWSALLGVLEEGVLTLGNNSTTDFRRSIVLMTSNVGSREMGELLERRPMGFAGSDAEVLDGDDAKRLAVEAAKAHFPDEFLNRFDKKLVYAPLQRAHLEAIFDKFLDEIHLRLLEQAEIPVLIKVGEEAKALLLDRGENLRFGARPLRRTVERELVDPLSRFIAGHTLEPGDVVEVEREDDRIVFYRASRAAASIVV